MKKILVHMIVITSMFYGIHITASSSSSSSSAAAKAVEADSKDKKV